MPEVRVALSGGPEDGQQAHVPADATGTPTPRFTIPAKPTVPGQRVPNLIYERVEQQQDGTWRFRYVGLELD